MFLDYDYPLYTQDDDDYEFCASFTECCILRMLKSYVELSGAYYGRRPTTLFTFEGARNFRNVYRDRYDALCALADLLTEAGTKDHAYFVSYLFEIWDNRDKYIKYLKCKKAPYLVKMPGVAYPSLHSIIVNGPNLIEEFRAIE